MSYRHETGISSGAKPYVKVATVTFTITPDWIDVPKQAVSFSDDTSILCQIPKHCDSNKLAYLKHDTARIVATFPSLHSSLSANTTLSFNRFLPMFT